MRAGGEVFRRDSAAARQFCVDVPGLRLRQGRAGRRRGADRGDGHEGRRHHGAPADRHRFQRAR